MLNKFFFLNKITIILIFMGVILSCANEQNTTKPEENTIKFSQLQNILESGVIKVGTTGDFNPMSFKDASTGDYVGHDIELVTQLAKDMGVTVEFVPTDWKNLVSGVVAGKYDITTQASYNMGRAKTAAYTDPIQGVGTVPLTLKKNVSRFNSWEDINKSSVKVAITLGTVFDEQTKQLLPDASRIVVESPARDFQEVLAGRADVSVTSTIEASQLIKTYPELAVIPAKAQFSNVMGLLVSQHDRILVEYINTWITQKKASGYLDTLRDKWLALK